MPFLHFPIYGPFPTATLTTFCHTCLSTQEVITLVQECPGRCQGLSSLFRAPVWFQKHSRIRALLGFISIGQLVACLHKDDQSLCLLLIFQGKGNLASYKDVPEIASFTIDAHHAANCTLKIKQRQTSAHIFPHNKDNHSRKQKFQKPLQQNSTAKIPVPRI